MNFCCKYLRHCSCQDLQQFSKPTPSAKPRSLNFCLSVTPSIPIQTDLSTTSPCWLKMSPELPCNLAGHLTRSQPSADHLLEQLLPQICIISATSAPRCLLELHIFTSGNHRHNQIPNTRGDHPCKHV